MRSCSQYLLITGIITEDVLNTPAHISAICSSLHALMLCYSEYFGLFSECFGRVHTLHVSGCAPSFPISDVHSDTHPPHTLRTDDGHF